MACVDCGRRRHVMTKAVRLAYRSAKGLITTYMALTPKDSANAAQNTQAVRRARVPDTDP